MWGFNYVDVQSWQRLTLILPMLDCQFFGLKAGGHHFVNVLWHSAAGVLLFLALAQMSPSRTGIWPSAFAAALFAIHPLRVESVAWIAERKDVLSGFFFMLTLLAYFYWTKKRTLGRYVTTSILFAFGLMSKPMVVTLPIVLLVLDYWPLNRGQRLSAGSEDPPGRREVTSQRKETILSLILEKSPLFILSAGSCVTTLWAQNLALGSTALLPLKSRIANAVVSYCDFIPQMVLPINLTPFYIHPENRFAL